VNRTTSTTAVGIEWSYVPDSPNVAMIGSRGDEPVALIEMCPRIGFRLTCCLSGRVETYQSLQEAQLAVADARAPEAVSTPDVSAETNGVHWPKGFSYSRLQ
jgi:hypothetical protein